MSQESTKQPDSNLKDQFNSFVENKKTSAEAKPAVCEACKQPMPTSTPYRSNNAQVNEQSNEDDTMLGRFFAKTASMLEATRKHTPKPISWMFKSLGWVVVGTVVAVVVIGVGYFVVRYIAWYALVAIGKWLLEKIGKHLPLGLAIDDPGSLSAWTDWEVGVAAGVGLIALGLLGKGVARLYRRYQINNLKPGDRVMVEGMGKATVIASGPDGCGHTGKHAVQPHWERKGGDDWRVPLYLMRERDAAYSLGLDPNANDFTFIESSKVRPLNSRET